MVCHCKQSLSSSEVILGRLFVPLINADFPDLFISSIAYLQYCALFSRLCYLFLSQTHIDVKCLDFKKVRCAICVSQRQIVFYVNEQYYN